MSVYAKLASFPDTFGCKMSSRQKYDIIFGNLLSSARQQKLGGSLHCIKGGSCNVRGVTVESGKTIHFENPH
jgi:hypothetical protein